MAGTGFYPPDMDDLDWFGRPIFTDPPKICRRLLKWGYPQSSIYDIYKMGFVPNKSPSILGLFKRLKGTTFPMGKLTPRVLHTSSAKRCAVASAKSCTLSLAIHGYSGWWLGQPSEKYYGDFKCSIIPNFSQYVGFYYPLH